MIARLDVLGRKIVDRHKQPGDNWPRHSRGDADWMALAACVAGCDPELFFPDNPHQRSGRHTVEAINRATTVCRGCPVATECLTYALDNDMNFGIWGGTTANERKQIRRQGLTPAERDTVARGRRL